MFICIGCVYNTFVYMHTLCMCVHIHVLFIAMMRIQSHMRSNEGVDKRRGGGGQGGGRFIHSKGGLVEADIR